MIIIYSHVYEYTILTCVFFRSSFFKLFFFYPFLFSVKPYNYHLSVNFLLANIEQKYLIDLKWLPRWNAYMKMIAISKWPC